MQSQPADTDTDGRGGMGAKFPYQRDVRMKRVEFKGNLVRAFFARDQA